MRVIFYKHEFAWPRTSGHDVHAFNMMRAMSAQGAHIGLVTRSAAPDSALDGAQLRLREVLVPASSDEVRELGLSRAEEKFRSYWGVPPAHIAHVGAIARDFRADAVVVVGLDVLPLLGAVDGAVRVWYAADEWCWHHASQIKLAEPGSWAELKQAIVKGLYERAYRRRVDRVWVVSEADARAMRWVAGMRGIDVLPNGVDADWYRPSADLGDPDTAVFWGRLDFGPNIQALQWFCQQVWPLVRQRLPSATFTIMGFNPTEPVKQLAALPGVVLQPNVPDVRTEVGRHAVVVLPFVSGGGIKNKLLEAAAMGRAVVCTSRACLGLTGNPPVTIAETPGDWTRALLMLWSDTATRAARGRALRAWVEVHHTWEGVAKRALAELERPRGTQHDSGRPPGKPALAARVRPAR
jgi:polysaccharide biosynthesis protein PslH